MDWKASQSESGDPIVMTFAALPLHMGITKYVIMALVIVLLVPMLISFLEREKQFDVFTVGDGTVCELPFSKEDSKCTEKFGKVFGELGSFYLKQLWMLLKPTLTIMILSSVLASLNMSCFF